MFDVVYVTYNSEKWIKRCFESWLSVDYDLKKINIYVVDNHSSDETVKCLDEFIKNYGNRFGSFNVCSETKNWGFGKGNNIGFERGSSEYVCFFNIDTELFADTMSELETVIKKANDNVALWELRQFPYEHPKMYNPLTCETSWSSGAAFAVKRIVFEQLHGFDEKIFMYAEDVDLSWRIRANGYKLQYVPKARIIHHSYESAGVVKPNQHVYSIVNNLLLRYRFGSFKTILNGHKMFFDVLRGPEAFGGSKKMLFKQYLNHFKSVIHFYNGGRYKNKNVENFLGWDYAPIRDGAFYENILPDQTPLVSIIVRTCGRPSILKETLISLRQQTYDNVEIVVVEDGEAKAEKMINEEFSDLNIIYFATKEKVGRSKAGNIAMELSHGQYLNFLDDDDLFYADHVEVLVATLLKSKKLAAYSTGFETPIRIISKEPYVYQIENYLGIYKQSFNRIMLCHHNYIPIQCIMFSRELFEKYGGLDETVDALEDWDLWVRYALYTDFEFVLKTTSEYRVPADRGVNAERQKALDEALSKMREKHKEYVQEISVSDMAKIYETLC